jgi:hypothetical protein
MPDFPMNQPDERLLELLKPLYSRLDVQIDIQVIQAIKRACVSHVPGSSLLVTVSNVSAETGVPWYKLFVFFAYTFGRVDTILELSPNSHPVKANPPS